MAEEDEDDDNLVPVPEGSDAPPPDTTQGDNLVGRMINNNYTVHQLISAGGMGEVYRGEGVLGDPVAIKIVLETLAQDEKVLTLFKREARILAQLNDDAIVRYFNFVKDADLDRYCLIMEFIDGTPLNDMVAEKGPITVDEAKRLMKRLARGLDKAHKREVTHRDLSPDNVMLPEGDVDRAVLIDFGIAKSTEMTEGTLHGQFAGKFKYISPEQLGHFDGAISPRTDVYGMALLVAASVRGTALDMGTSVVEAVNARREIPDLEGIYTELRPLLAHMLEPDPNNRPASMRDVARMLDDPSRIPPKYGAADADKTRIAPPQGEGDRTVVAPLSTPPVGLQRPPTAAPSTAAPVTGSGLQDASHSPFGGPTAAPIGSLPPVPEVTAAGAASVPEKKGGGRLVLPLILLLAAGGGGVWYAMQAGLIGGTAVEEAAQTPEAEEADPEDPVAQMPAPDSDTREGFLAGYKANVGCSYASRVASGVNAGKLEVIAGADNMMPDLPQAYQVQFGAEPAMVERAVSAEQCAALDLVRSLQGREAIPPVLTLDTDSVKSGGSVAGRVRDVRGRTVWMFLVSTAGGVYNLSPRLESQADGSYTFGFGMSLAAGAEASPQLIVTLASEAPLLSAAAATDGSSAEDILPLVLAEIAGRGGTAAADIGWFQLEGEG
ncbi:serine/threonine protein kinase [uncultured Litoreibacter sp.]|uniref:serine/threonine-protein kinase n=1 Tax=uncultured Litoreibacter sp. TaxID=1392394 RepID=UPI0026049596|nr:serine/threonine protein kinase [uncultured Litoreibacter sp.]